MRLTRRRPGARAGLVLAALVLSAVLAAIAAAPGAATSEGVVSLTLREWKLTPSKVAVSRGRVSFVVRNDGTMPHEFLVLRSDSHHHSLAVRKGKAVEKGRQGRIPMIPSGTAKKLTLKLLPGKYVLLCNMLGHYQAGQYAALRVR